MIRSQEGASSKHERASVARGRGGSEMGGGGEWARRLTEGHVGGGREGIMEGIGKERGNGAFKV